MERGIYTEEHQIFREAYIKFIEKEVAPFYEQWEKDGIVPKLFFRKLGEQGFLCSWLDEKYGGVGAGFEYSAVMIEEGSRRGFAGIGAGLHSNVVVPYLNSFGSEEQKEKWLPGCVTGEIITAIAMTEPGAGSDLAALRTTAIKDGNDYIINGQKTFISNGINSNLVIVACKTDPMAGYKGVSLVVVEEGTPGFSRGRNLEKMGMHSQDTAELIFEDCRVPRSNLLGAEGKGFYYLMTKLQRERLVSVMGSQAMAESMLDMTVKYCKERHIFGKPLSAFQHNAFKLVEMATEIELGRVFVDAMTRDHIAGIDITKRVSMAKAWISEMANRVAGQCVQLHGGYGYCEEYPICRFYRDVRVHTIFAGATEVMKSILAKMMGI